MAFFLKINKQKNIIGLQPCEKFAAMRVEEFVEIFCLHVLKVELNTIPLYNRHVVLLVREFIVQLLFFLETVTDSQKTHSTTMC